MIEYQRDVPADSPPDVIAAEQAHVRDHLAAIAGADDQVCFFEVEYAGVA